MTKALMSLINELDEIEDVGRGLDGNHIFANREN